MRDYREIINFWRYHEYLHLYKVEGLHDKLCEEKEYYLYEYEKGKEYRDKEGSANVPLRSDRYEFMNEVCRFITKEYYNVSDDWESTCCNAYIQDKDNYRDVWHHHMKDTSITATAYIDPPEPDNGGELELWYPPQDPFKYHPEKDVIAFFPSWLLHRPLPQTIDEKRICLNWGYISYTRPTNKLTGDRW